jgi:hypothetical protein
VIRGADRVARNLLYYLASDTRAPGTPAVVRASWLVTVMRPLVKLLNPVTGDTFVVPLTFADRSDWSGNVGSLGIRQCLLLGRAAS